MQSADLTTPGGTVIAGVPVNPAKEEFDLALGYYKQKEYENAEKGFSAFLQKNPKNRLASDAIYYLGESFYLRGRPREAAEQYLKISTNYASSGRAPEAMLRLGQSLHAIGAKEQACATFSEVVRKYPNASASVKTGAEREAKRAQC
jgi:tol-pal system protein YbgF